MRRDEKYSEADPFGYGGRLIITVIDNDWRMAA
jgi:hypothetical protein